MFSLIVYGRNDSYGYNLHKRAALSLNCMAEVLDDPDDEILFVDYNTPDDYPTFPEAIQDTLTEKAKQHLRILRVRSKVHNRLFRKKSHLICLEPISRNVAIRRSNPSNRWILSTNTDMIFVPRKGRTLNEALGDLPDGFYGAPRFEIPETIWETFDRYDGRGVIDQTAHWAEVAHLNEIVHGMDDILYDGPGDFQLMLRDDLFRIHGFHEGMLLGWHVDANISKRLRLIYGNVGDAGERVFGYHCDHTRQVTPAHKHNSVENSSDTFIAKVDAPEIPEQAENWGCEGETVEEVRLTQGHNINDIYMSALASVMTQPLKEPYRQYYRPESYNKERAHTEHVVPFLADIFVNAPRTEALVWVGPKGQLFEMFRSVIAKLGFLMPVRAVPADADEDTAGDMIDGASAFIFNFGVPDILTGDAANTIRAAFQEVVQREILRTQTGRSPRRIVGVNAIHNEFEGLVTGYIGCARGPFSTKLRHGFILPVAVEYPLNWTDAMQLSSGSTRTPAGIVARIGHRGHVAYGPYKPLFAGRYQARLRIAAAAGQGWSWRGAARDLGMIKDLGKVEIVINEREIAEAEITSGATGEFEFTLPFRVTKDFAGLPVQVRLSSSGAASLTFKNVAIDLLLPGG